jgi:hypothetical protein
MTERVGQIRNPDQHRIGDHRTRTSKLLNRIAANPWILSCGSFVLTALVVRSNDLSPF